MVLGVGMPSGDQADVMCFLSERQSRHLQLDREVKSEEPFRLRNWERRRDLVKLRVLQKCQRMCRCSDASFALLMQQIMELPVAVPR